MIFNDEPFDTSLVTHALSTRQRRKVVETQVPRLWNLMWPTLGAAQNGTFYFDNQPNLLDQFLVNRNLASQQDPLQVQGSGAAILQFPETIGTGRYPRPRPFGGMGKPIDPDGFSDHFPIAVRVTESA